MGQALWGEGTSLPPATLGTSSSGPFCPEPAWEWPWLEEEVSRRTPAKSGQVWGCAGPIRRSPRLWPREEQTGVGSVFEQAVGAEFTIQVSVQH